MSADNQENSNRAPEEQLVSGIPAGELKQRDGAVPGPPSRELALAGADANPERQPGGEFAAAAAERMERVEPPPPAEEAEGLPSNLYDSPGFRAANDSAKANFESVVRRPGYVFIAPGRYHNVENLEEVFDVAPDTRVPEGLFLIGDNYLLRGRAREQALERGR